MARSGGDRMSLESIYHHFSPWMEVSGPENDVVVSSRIRLARNLSGLTFPCQEKDEDLKEVLLKAKGSVDSKLKKECFRFFSMEDLSSLDREFLVAKHLISPALAVAGPHRAVAINEEEIVTIMINEEDHLRVQGLVPGLNLQKTWERMGHLDDRLEEDLDYAFDERWGYLTSCPTNMGTGLRASVMVHLPALELTGRTRRILSTISQLGLAVRGLYGEGTESAGNIFQISNQITLGQKEEEIIDNLAGVTKQIIDQERNARLYLLKKGPDGIKDRVFRAYGILSYAHRINVKEALALISDVRLGVDLQLMDDVDANILSELMVTITPAFLQRLEEEGTQDLAMDLKRASWIRERMRKR